MSCGCIFFIKKQKISLDIDCLPLIFMIFILTNLSGRRRYFEQNQGVSAFSFGFPDQLLPVYREYLLYHELVILPWTWQYGERGGGTAAKLEKPRLL
jgi:hypothetical protein